MFESGNNTKIVNAYPALLKYRKNENDMSSVSSNWKVNGSIHVDKTDEYIIKEISKLIPRPFNFGFIRIIYDNVHWYDDINKMPAFNGDNAPGAVFTDMHQSNAIEVKKQFDYGKKYNLVEIKIEVTCNDNQILNDEDIFYKLTNAFGKCIYSNMICKLNDKERQQFSEYNKKLQFELNEFIKNYEIALSGNIINTEQSNITPKKAIMKTIKGTGFKYYGCKNGVYDCKRINNNHHLTQIEFLLTPLSHSFYANISFRGYNFGVFVDGSGLFEYIDNVQNYVDIIFKLTDDVEKFFAEKMEVYFNKTPDWYEYT